MTDIQLSESRQAAMRTLMHDEGVMPLTPHPASSGPVDQRHADAAEAGAARGDLLPPEA